MLPKVPKQPPRAKPRSTTPRADEPTPLLEQRHLDLLGLALIAFGVLIAVPLFRAGAGGVVGEAVADGARVLLGATAVAAPIIAIAGGLVAVSPISAAATMRMGGGALAAFGSVALIARAAEGPDTGAVWATDHLAAAGGALGELLWTACFSAFGTFGPYVVAVVMMLGAALLLTGAEIAAVGAGAGRGLARAMGAPGRMRAQRRAEAAMALTDHSPAAERAAGEDLWPIGDPSAGAAVPADVDGGTITATRRAVTPPEPVGVATEAAPRTWTSFDGEESLVARGAGATGEISVVRLNPREVQLVDGAERFPDLYGGDGPIWIGPDEPSPAPQRPASRSRIRWPTLRPSCARRTPASLRLRTSSRSPTSWVTRLQVCACLMGTPSMAHPRRSPWTPTCSARHQSLRPRSGSRRRRRSRPQGRRPWALRPSRPWVATAPR